MKSENAPGWISCKSSQNAGHATATRVLAAASGIVTGDLRPWIVIITGNIGHCTIQWARKKSFQTTDPVFKFSSISVEPATKSGFMKTQMML
jgi:hypothetical protein